ncbi:AAA family ATPase [Citromicrobium bathyomarinum]
MKFGRFGIEGLFGTKNVEFPINGPAIIIVGPNGVGKSSVTNIFYFFISRQWARLLEYQFERVYLEFENGDQIETNRDEISGLVDLDRAMANLPSSSRMRVHIELLRANGILERFLVEAPTTSLKRQIANLLGVSVGEIPMIRRAMRRRLVEDEESGLFQAPRQDLEQKLSSVFTGRTLYLPTYRRIEKDLDDIFPEFEERVREIGYRNRTFGGRSGESYIDLVSFGMEDVRRTIKSRLNNLRDYSLAQFNALSGLYLRDVIRGQAQEFSEEQISSLGESGLRRILGRVSEEILTDNDKALLRDKIMEIGKDAKAKIDVSDSYLAHYVNLLMNVGAEISKQENDIIDFIEVCNAYLEPGKAMVYDDSRFEIEIVDDMGRDIDLSKLSSGEKQVVSLFSHLYLESHGDQVVIIDEPELSLSVPWQKRFLTDIVDSPRCKLLFSVTHSPFIYQNKLEACAIDLRKFSSEV